MVFGKGFDGAGKVEPDYARASASRGPHTELCDSAWLRSSAARAKTEGAKVVFVDPRTPEGALMSSGAEWIPIRPGADSAFLLSLIRRHYGKARRLRIPPPVGIRMRPTSSSSARAVRLRRRNNRRRA
ncbi:MAG: hypothetical protein V8T46_06470 [Sutterella seckii]